MADEINKECCEVCGDNGPLFLHARCHIGAPVEVMLVGGDTLVVRCSECNREAGRFRVVQE